MLPDHALSSEPVRGAYLPPTTLNKNLLEYYELGGIAIQDPSMGLQYQAWKCYYNSDSNQVRLLAGTTGVDTLLFTLAGIVEISFCFDQNMRWSVVYKLESGDVEFRWFDSSEGDYVITVYPDTYLSPKLTLDDKRPLQSGSSDMILTYIRSDNLYMREQRDRFLVEYLLYEDLPAGAYIRNFGMNSVLRLQWRFGFN